MFNLFKKKKKKQKKSKRSRRGIPTAEEQPRIASTVTTRLSDGSPAPQPMEPEEVNPEPEPVPVMVKEPEAPVLPGPDELPPATPEIDARFDGKTPEQLCAVDPLMPPDEIRAKLSKLFLRHNRAASSFDLDLRAEAEIMLRAIVTVREKYLETL